jgi:hypothetical protein
MDPKHPTRGIGGSLNDEAIFLVLASFVFSFLQRSKAWYKLALANDVVISNLTIYFEKSGVPSNLR